MMTMMAVGGSGTASEHVAVHRRFQNLAVLRHILGKYLVRKTKYVASPLQYTYRKPINLVLTPKCRPIVPLRAAKLPEFQYLDV